MSLRPIELHQRAGKGSKQFDIKAKDRENGKVIVENMLKPLDHDHWGKAIHYAQLEKAATVVLCATRADDDFIEATIAHNAEQNAQTIFIVKVEAKRVKGVTDSKVFIEFTLLAGPGVNMRPIGVKPDWVYDKK